MKAEELKKLYDAINALPTAAEQIAAFQKALEDLNGNFEQLSTDKAKSDESLTALKGQFDALQSESEAEVAKLSKELEFYNSPKTKGLLIVDIGNDRYTTPAGRKYMIGGKTIAAEDLVKDDAAVKKLIGSGSHIFTKA